MANTLKLPVGIAFTGMGKGDSFYTSKAFWKDTQYEYA